MRRHQSFLPVQRRPEHCHGYLNLYLAHQGNLPSPDASETEDCSSLYPLPWSFVSAPQPPPGPFLTYYPPQRLRLLNHPNHLHPRHAQLKGLHLRHQRCHVLVSYRNQRRHLCRLDPIIQGNCLPFPAPLHRRVQQWEEIRPLVKRQPCPAICIWIRQSPRSKQHYYDHSQRKGRCSHGYQYWRGQQLQRGAHYPPRKDLCSHGDRNYLREKRWWERQFIRAGSSMISVLRL